MEGDRIRARICNDVHFDALAGKQMLNWFESLVVVKMRDL